MISLVLYESTSVTLQIVSVIFNVAIICTLSKRSLIRCTSNKFVFSLCLSHLIISILTLLISASQFLGSIRATKEIEGADDSILISGPKLAEFSSETQNLPISLTFVLSHILLYVTLTVVIGTSLNVALISVERYITIAHPMKYKSIVTPGRCTTVILICWVLPLVLVPLPVLVWGNQTILHGSFAMPSGRLGLYYGIVFSCVTFFVLSVMILCYLHIFIIAKAKCQKVQIGHFTSPVSSISSDWPSTAYSSQADPHCQLKLSHSHSPATVAATIAPKDVHRLSSPNSLLQYVLLTNLGRHAQTPLRVPLNELSAEGKIVSMSTLSQHQHQQKTTGGPDVQTQSRLIRNDFHHGQSQHGLSNGNTRVQLVQQYPSPALRPKRWKTFLKQSYNSPRKTVSTIVILISSLILTQLPLTIALFFPTQGFSLFYFSFKHLFPFASLTNPILYGFLNRTIRVHLFKFLRIRRRHRGFALSPRKVGSGRKASTSSVDSGQFFKREISFANEDEKISISIQDRNCSLSNSNEQISKSHSTVSLNDLSRNAANIAESEEPQARDSQSEKDLQIASIPTIPEENEEVDSNDVAEVTIELGDLLSTNFPRKPSQDSGVDVTFSEDEEEDCDCDAEKGQDI